MKIWKVKAVIQKTISFLPFPNRINFLFQKYVTRGVVLTDALFMDKLTHCQRHIEYYNKYSSVKENFTALEIGTGWYPIVPIGLYLAGAQQIYSIDISPLLSRERVINSIEKYIALAAKGSIPFEIKQDRLENIKRLLQHHQLDMNALLKQMNITSIVGDARKLSLPDACIDLINSNNTFEHIYPHILTDILKEFSRLLKADGVMSHAIDMSDHFAHLDHSITRYNFLQYTDAEWSRIDNSIQPQNRMRLYEHIELYRQNNIPVTETVITGKGDDTIKQVVLDERFRKHSPEENAIVHASIISKS